MGSEIEKHNPRRRPSDLYGGIATVSECGLLISPTSEWDLKQRRVWPPAPYQAYCEKHFLQECLVYYSLEMEKIEEETERKKKEKDNNKNQVSEAETSPSTTATSRAAHPQLQPTRVQPGRRAKGSSAPTQSETQHATSSSSRRRKYQDLSDSEYERMERRQELCLELSWAEFQAKVEAVIKRASKKLSRKHAKKSSPHDNGTTASGKKERKKKASPPEAGAEGDLLEDGDHCPLQGLIKDECRYCDHRPEITGGGGGDADDAKRSSPPPPPPNRGAPVAPMHMLGEADFGPDQICTFGGLAFAVDVCGGAESVVVVLMEMKSLGLGPKDGDKGHGDAVSKPKMPAQHGNKRTKTGKRQDSSDGLNWIPEADETD
ncbi:hypothetical protein PG984_007983 [Apiospora sp. TS-2023a]